MQNNFLEYLQKNGVEAFDKMAADLAKQLNDAKAQYEADQKKKAEEDKKAKDRAENRAVCVKQFGRLLKFYFGDALTADPEEIADTTFKSIEKTLVEKKDPEKPKWESKMEVIKDEKTPTSHIKVMRGDLSDLTEEELADFWNGVHETFFKVD